MLASGYDESLLLTEFPLPIPGRMDRLDVVAFARRAPLDMTTAAVAGETLSGLPTTIGGEQVRDAARSIAAPIALIEDGSRLDLWQIAPTASGDHQLGYGNDARELAGRFSQVTDPQALLAAKEGRQLTLFPLDASLLAQARRGTSSALADLISEAMLGLVGDRTKLSTPDWQEVVRLVVQALAALVVRDKFELPGRGSAILDAAAFQFPGFFMRQNELSPETLARLTTTISTLEQGVNYRAVDSAVVSRVYEDAVVSTAARAQQGIYYTPPELAERILEAVPIEELDPNRRIVLDPACGSGTLLLAAHNRLSRLLPDATDGDQRQAYLRGHLIGWDSDLFATEIAKLSLLLNALPYGNHWQVNHLDALETPIPDERAGLVVSNPPWRGQRSVEHQRSEQALPFLQRMLELTSPGGFVAAVLPASWLQSKVAAVSRRALADRAEIFEIWRLPEGTFESAGLAPCVVIARASMPRPRGWVYRRVRDTALRAFYQSGTADEQWLSPSPAVGAFESTFMRGPFDDLLDRLTAFPKLSDIADVESSPVPEPGMVPNGMGDHLLLRKARDFAAYGTLTGQEVVRVRYPADFHLAGAARGESLKRPKVILSSRRSPATPWRMKVGLDLIGVIPRESLHFAVPHDGGEDELYALLALLGSRLASAWVDTYEPKRSINIGLLRRFPVPPDGAMWRLLADAGRRLASATDPGVTVELARAADALVEVAYGLPDRNRRQLDAIFRGRIAPEGRARYESTPQTRNHEGGQPRSLFGAVLEIAPPLLRLWIPGLTPDDGLWTELPPGFPGWLCRDGATFDVLSRGSLDGADFAFQRRAYMDPETWDDAEASRSG